MLNIAYAIYSAPEHVLIRFFRDDSTNTVNSATISYMLNGVVRCSAVSSIVVLQELNAYIQQEVTKNENTGVKGT